MNAATVQRLRRVLVTGVGLAAGLAGSSPSAEPAEPGRRPAREVCRLLDDPDARPLMDAVLHHLLPACGRERELGLVAAPDLPAAPGGDPDSAGSDVLVNDPGGDSGVSQTQSETALALSGLTGTLCAGYNDSFHRVEDQGVVGFSRSVDGGATFTDQGALDPASDGDPSLVWRRADGFFYFATLADGGVGLWRSTDDCRTFEPVGPVHEGTSDDKELMAVDNNPGSPYFGRLYVAWTDFAAGGIRLARSDDGGDSWSSPVRVSLADASVQGAWPAVAPGGDLYVAWTRFASGRFSIEAGRSVDGGRTFEAVSPPAVDRVRPEDQAATAACARSALAGPLRYAPFAQLAAGPDGVLHVVYSADPDGAGAGDVVDVFYRRSSDRGASWSDELRLNDDATVTDQFFPTLAVGAGNVLTASWYDRRLDPANLLIDHYRRRSLDGGLTWQPSVRVSDVSTPVWLDPAMATCYHSDYDIHLQDPGRAIVQWSDDRNVHAGHPDPDVFVDPQPLSDDFLVIPDPWTAAVCAPADAVYLVTVPQFGGFSEPVSMAVAGLPPGTTGEFSIDPVVPPGASELAVSGTAAAAADRYNLEIAGTSSPGGIRHAATVALEVFTAVPPPPPTLEPPPGAGETDVRPTLVWSASEQASSYELEVAADSTFSDIVYATTTAATSHRLQQPLQPERTYAWRVRGANPCGDGLWSQPSSFTTRSVPPLLLVDDDDNQPDVRTAYEEALVDLGRSFDVWDTANSDDEPTAADLALYRAVIWFAGREYGGSAGPGAEGAAALAAWLDRGPGCVLMSGQDILWDRGVTPLFEDYFGIADVDDDTQQTAVTGEGVFAGLGPYALEYPFTNYSDTLVAGPEAAPAFAGDQGVAAVSLDGARFRTTFLAFPLEAIPGAADRAQVIVRLLDACTAVFSDGFESGDAGAWSGVLP